MQPLTPNERREVEKRKKDAENIRQYTGNYTMRMAITITPKNADLWLKVLSMALEHNDKLSDEWRSKK